MSMIKSFIQLHIKRNLSAYEKNWEQSTVYNRIFAVSYVWIFELHYLGVKWNSRFGPQNMMKFRAYNSITS